MEKLIGMSCQSLDYPQSTPVITIIFGNEEASIM